MSKDKKRLVPVRRFKEFENSAAWELRKLGELAPLRGGYAFKSENYTEIGVPILRISNILNTGLVGNDFVKCMPINMDEEFSLQNEDVVIALSGATTGKIAILKTNMERKYYQNQRVGHFMRTDKCDYSFITILVQKSSFKKQLHSTLVAGAQPNISPKEVDSFKFLIPKSRNEQQQIGTLFKHLDELITLHQRKLDKLKRVKSAYLTELFPAEGEREPKRRFPGFTGAWEQRKFSDIAIRESKKAISASNNPSVEYEDIVAEEGKLNKDIYNKKVVKKGIQFDNTNILYGKLRPYLHNWLNASFSGVAVGDWWVLKPIEIRKSFLYFLIQTQKYDNVANLSTGSKMPRSDWHLVSNTKFDIPTAKEEQEKIGRFLGSIDSLIALHQRKLDKLKKMKAAYLNEMFV